MDKKHDRDEVIKKSIKKILGEPVFLGLSNYTLKLRRNLVVTSSIAILYKLSNAKIILDNKITVFGISFSGVKQDFVDISFCIFLFYNFFHYVFEIWEVVLRWKIRLSGTFKEVIKSSSNGSGLDLSIEGIDQCINLEDVGYGHNEQSYLYSLFAQLINYNSNNLKGDNDNRKNESLEAILFTIKEALNRFEKSFKQFQKIQVLRFFTCDLILPILIYFYATFLLIYRTLDENIPCNVGVIMLKFSVL